MSKITKAWVEAQMEKEMERGNHPEAVRDLAALITVHGYLCGEVDDVRQYGRRYTPEEHHKAIPVHDPDKLTQHDAESWVNHMRAADGSHHVRWSLDEIRQYAGNFGIRGEDVIPFFAIMNAMYSDYGMVAQKYGVDKVDFWSDMTKAFIHDVDAVPGKVKKYYQYIVQHDD